MRLRLVVAHKNALHLPRAHRCDHSTSHGIATSAAGSTDAGLSTPARNSSVATTWSLIDKVLPRSRFAQSIYSTPILLLLRLFYQAIPFDKSDIPTVSSHPRSGILGLFRNGSCTLDEASSNHAGYTAGLGKDGVLDIGSKTSTGTWSTLLQDTHYPINPTSKVQSMTWVKSLSAPLSHEYVQFVIENEEFGTHYRLVAERDTDGDWAYLIASAGSSESFESANITQLRSYDYRHDLPLPLLSVSWSRLPGHERPTAAQLASVLQRTSKLFPEYNVMREHCWWYAESIFEEMFALSSSNRQGSDIQKGSDRRQSDLKHWPAGAYRYSYVVLGQRILRRDVLIQQAKAFRMEMDQDRQLRW